MEGGIQKQQKNRYKTNPEIRKKKIGYASEKYQKELLDEKIQQREEAKVEAQQMIIRKDENCKSCNRYEFKVINWISDFLKHFLDTFEDIPKDTKGKIKGVISLISNNFSNNVSEIDELVNTA